jgi:hypothetical protein
LTRSWNTDLVVIAVVVDKVAASGAGAMLYADVDKHVETAARD